MSKFYACILVMWLFVSFAAYAQSPTISVNIYDNAGTVCLNTPYRLSVSTTSTFHADNRFSIQVRKSETSAVLAELPAEMVAGRLIFTLKDSLAYAGNILQFKALASSPKVESAWSGAVIIHTKGRIVLNPDHVTDTLNAFDYANIRFAGISLSKVDVTLDDSTALEVYGLPSTNSLLVPGNRPAYTIAHAENGCGSMQVSGKYQPVINTTAVKASLATPSSVCENSDVKVTFSTSGTPFTAQTRFRLRLTEVTYDASVPLKLEIPATVIGNMLTARIPDNLKWQSHRQFNIQIITENPSTRSGVASNTLTIWPKPRATFETASHTIDYLGESNIVVAASGPGPFIVELTDGTKFTGPGERLNFWASPTSDQTYSIKSVNSGCGKTDITEPETMQIKVRPGIAIYDDGINNQKTCAGPNSRIRFSSNANLTAATQFKVKVTYYPGPTVLFNATRSGDYLEFATPIKPEGYSGFGVQIITSNPAMESPTSFNVQIITPPKVGFTTNLVATSFTKPTLVRIGYELDGGGPYTIEELDGTTKTYDYTTYQGPWFFVKETMDYKIKSVSNGCFKNEAPGGIRLTIHPTNEPAIYMEPMKTAVCNNDSLEITFGSVGQFGPGNKFTIQGTLPCCNFEPLAVVEKGGKYKIKLSDEFKSGMTEIRIASSNPVLFTDVARVAIHRPATDFYYSHETTQQEPLRYIPDGTPTSISISSKTSVVESIAYSENGLEKIIAVDPYDTRLPLNPKTGILTTYVVKSATNTCGTFPVDKAFYVQAMPNRIQLNPLASSPSCVGFPLAMGINIVQGPVTNATYSLEMAAPDSKEYKPLITGEKGYLFSTVVPDNLINGIYRFRVASSDGSISEPLPMQISTLPSATLTNDPSQPNPITIGPGQPVILRVVTSGAVPMTTVFSDNTRKDFNSNEETVRIVPKKGQQYSILSVSNVCGYGSASGKVEVRVTPRLVATTSSPSVCEGGSVNLQYELQGDAELSGSYIRFSLADQNNVTIPLDSTQTPKGNISLKIPELLKGSSYRIIASVSSYNLNVALNIGIATKADVTLSGNTIINSGESTKLTIRSNKNNSAMVTYRLSDGTTGDLFTSGGSVHYVSVTPKQTTTYAIASISNSCGEGITSGSAIVEVNPPSARSVTVTSLASKTANSFCSGDTILVGYKTTGAFSAGNTFTVQLSDSTGRTFHNITTIRGANPVQAVLPADLSANAQYRLRVAASDANTASGAYGLPVVSNRKASARFASESVIFDGVNNPKVTVLLEGGGPWSYQFGTDISVVTRQSSTPTDVVELFQASASQLYRLFRVSNSCGIGTIGSPSTVRVEVITAIEPNATGLQVIVAPNPAHDILTVKSGNGDEKHIQLISQSGAVVQMKKTRQRDESLDIRSLSPGVYILHINSKGKNATFKVIKQ